MSALGGKRTLAGGRVSFSLTLRLTGEQRHDLLRANLALLPTIRRKALDLTEECVKFSATKDTPMGDYRVYPSGIPDVLERIQPEQDQVGLFPD